MRSRFVIVLALALAVGTVAPATSWGPGAFAQEVGEGSDAQPQEEGGVGGEDTGGEGQDQPGAETDPGQGTGVEEEEGPPWTYQMSWMTLVTLLLVGLALGSLYYRYVVVRRREGF